MLNLRLTDADIVGSQQHFVERRTDLGAGQHRSEAMVRASPAECDVGVGISGDVEVEGPVEHFLIADGRPSMVTIPGTLGDEGVGSSTSRVAPRTQNMIGVESAALPRPE